MDNLPGHLADNVMHFARVLRAAGLAVGTDRIELALAALPIAGLASRRDFHATLAACMLTRAEQRELFDQAFMLFWRDPDLSGRLLAMLLPQVRTRTPGRKPASPRRLHEALQLPHAPQPANDAPPQKIEVDARWTFSERELLQQADFETMSADEWREAQRLVAQLKLVVPAQATRRFEAAARPGRIDLRATLRGMAHAGGELAPPRWRHARRVRAPLVLLADISGSMSGYSRMLLHYAHAVAHSGLAVESFVFGTRLTRITRDLRRRDPDVALAQVQRNVADWSGGTRLAACLREFNRRWARRVLDSRATVLLVTDGLEHGDADALAFEMERLHKSCRRLVWLNPLLRYDGFEPRAAGMRAMRPHVDDLIAAHNLASLSALAALLANKPSSHTSPRTPCN